MLTTENIDDLLQRNGNVLSLDGNKIGSVGQVYADDTDGQPTWVTVKTGLFGTSESFVPLQGARLEGDDIVVPYTKDQVKDAPRVETDGHLEPSEEDRLFGHYGLDGHRDYSETGTRGDASYAETGNTAHSGTVSGTADATSTVGRDTSGPTTDDAMTRSEERLNVGYGEAGSRAGQAAQIRHHRERHHNRSGPARRGPDRARTHHGRKPWGGLVGAGY